SPKFLDIYFGFNVRLSNPEDVDAKASVADYCRYQAMLANRAGNYTAVSYLMDYAALQISIVSAEKSLIATKAKIDALLEGAEDRDLNAAESEELDRLIKERTSFEEQINYKRGAIESIRTAVSDQAIATFDAYLKSNGKSYDAMTLNDLPEIFEEMVKTLNAEDGLDAVTNEDLMSAIEKIANARISAVRTDRGAITFYIGTNVTGMLVKTFFPMLLSIFRGPDKRQVSAAMVQQTEDFRKLMESEIERGVTAQDAFDRYTVARLNWAIALYKLRQAQKDPEAGAMELYQAEENYNAAVSIYMRQRLEVSMIAAVTGINTVKEDEAVVVSIADAIAQNEERKDTLFSQVKEGEIPSGLADAKKDFIELLFGNLALPESQVADFNSYSKWLKGTVIMRAVDMFYNKDGILTFINENISQTRVEETYAYTSAMTVAGGYPDEKQTVSAQGVRTIDITERSQVEVLLRGAVETSNYGLNIIQGTQSFDTGLKLKIKGDDYDLEFPVLASYAKDGEWKFTVGAGYRTKNGLVIQAGVTFDEEENIRLSVNKIWQSVELGTYQVSAAYNDGKVNARFIGTPVGLTFAGIRPTLGVEVGWDTEKRTTTERLMLDLTKERGAIRLNMNLVQEIGTEGEQKTLGRITMATPSNRTRFNTTFAYKYETEELTGKADITQIFKAFGGTFQLQPAAEYTAKGEIRPSVTISGQWEGITGALRVSEPTTQFTAGAKLGEGALDLGVTGQVDNVTGAYQATAGVTWHIIRNTAKRYGDMAALMLTNYFSNPDTIFTGTLNGLYVSFEFGSVTDSYAKMYDDLEKKIDAIEKEYMGPEGPGGQWAIELDKLRELRQAWRELRDKMQAERAKGVKYLADWSAASEITRQHIEILRQVNLELAAFENIVKTKMADEKAIKEFSEFYTANVQPLQKIVNELIERQTAELKLYESTRNLAQEKVTQLRSSIDGVSESVTSWNNSLAASANGLNALDSQARTDMGTRQSEIAEAESNSETAKVVLAMLETTGLVALDAATQTAIQTKKEALLQKYGAGAFKYSSNPAKEALYWATLSVVGGLSETTLNTILDRYHYIFSNSNLAVYLGLPTGSNIKAGYWEDNQPVLQYWDVVSGIKSKEWAATEINNRVKLIPEFEKLVGFSFDRSDVDHVKTLALFAGTASFQPTTGAMKTIAQVEAILETINTYRGSLENIIGQRDPLDTTYGLLNIKALVDWAAQTIVWDKENYPVGRLFSAMQVLKAPYLELLKVDNVVNDEAGLNAILADPLSLESFALQVYVAQISALAIIPTGGYDSEFIKEFIASQPRLDEKIKALSGVTDPASIEGARTYFGVLSA
ncbi:MAG TPA: hypothetical protein PLV52_01985, partial [Candidatus Omnitrophota bacterium]|nr:hypothetical protein [Candidatus Omnitrophota bacterium]